MTEEQHIDNPFDKLTDLQWRFITAMLEDKNRTKKDAALHIGIKPDTTYRWGSHVDEALALALVDVHEAAKAARKQMLLKAIKVKAALLDSDDEAIRSKAATEFIEWELGKATQINALSNPDGSTLRINITHDND
jgi:hypothetical protein